MQAIGEDENAAGIENGLHSDGHAAGRSVIAVEPFTVGFD
jgi:hypothetical protein